MFVEGLLLVAALSAAPPCPQGAKCSAQVKISGQFDRTPHLEVGSPPVDFQGPPVVSVSDEALRLLNERLPEALKDTLAEWGLSQTGAAAPLPREGLTGLDGDQAFAVELTASPKDPSGGADGGNVLRVTLRSLQRPDRVYGQVRQAVVITPKLRWQGVALRTAVREGLRRAFEDLRQRIAETFGPDGRALALSIKVNGLDAKGRAFVVDRLVPCVRGLFEAAPRGAPPREAGGYLEAHLSYHPREGEPREALPYQLDRIRRALGYSQTAECSLAELSVARPTVKVSADTLNRAVVVSLSSP